MRKAVLRRLKVAVIGVGFWGRNHARVLSGLEKAELVAVCDLDESRARTVAEKYGAEAYTDSTELLRREDIEAVTICTWSTVLSEEARKALEAGKHVLVEKPMAKSSKEARELVELAEKEDLILAVGFVERFNPGLRRVLEMVGKGEVGEVLSALARRLSRWPKRPWDVGVVRDLAIHDLDILRHIFGCQPESVYARVRYSNSGIDDYAFITLSFPDGMGLVETSWLTAPKVRELVVSGTEGVLKLDYLTQAINILRRGDSEPYEVGGEWREPLKIELEHFVECVLYHKEPLVSGRDGLLALSLCEAALESSAKGRPVSTRHLAE